MQLLGKECCDIDIALDNMLGKEFCEKVNEYLSSTGDEAQGIGVIQWYTFILFILLVLSFSIKHSYTYILHAHGVSNKRKRYDVYAEFQ
jgi:hypothetical protein